MQITRERIIEEIRKIANKLGKNQLSLSEFRFNSAISDWYVWKLFDSWNEAIEQAGLTPHREKEKISDDTLFIEMERVFLGCEGVCNRTRFNRLSKYSVDTFKKRFGHWNSILKAFRDWLEKNRKEFPFMNQLPKITSQSLTSKKSIEEEQTEKTTSWNTIGSTMYGSFLNFRGLQHEPLNEQGVVFLFGMIFLELGFIVEMIRNEYPDCEAKRRVDRNHDRWERVRIEFEYRSSTFKDHGHNPKGCDLIVCWIHDWKECPIEVIELKSEIKKLNS